jgi:uroporphyrinogen decarboxylase
MTARERILAAVEHREPDRVPVDLGSTPSSGISGIAYGRLKNHLGETRGHTRVYDVVQQLAQPEYFILERFGIDVLDIGRTFNTADSDWYDVELADGSKAQYPAWFHPTAQSDGSWEASVDGRVIAKMPPEGTFFDQTYFPYVNGYPDSFENLPVEMGKILWAALVHSPWDHVSEPDFWQTLRSRTQQLKGSTDRALMIVVGCNLFEWGSFLRRLDNFLMDLVADQYNVERLLDALMEQHLSFLEKVCTAVGDLVDIARFGDDLGMDQGPFMPPEIYMKLFKPRHAKLCDFVKKHSQMHTFIHTCGSIYELLPHLIEAGFEIINPVQTNARNMGPAKLKAEFGRDLTFWGGGADTRQVLNRGTPREVKSRGTP